MFDLYQNIYKSVLHFLELDFYVKSFCFKIRKRKCRALRSPWSWLWPTVQYWRMWDRKATYGRTLQNSQAQGRTDDLPGCFWQEALHENAQASSGHCTYLILQDIERPNSHTDAILEWHCTLVQDPYFSVILFRNHSYIIQTKAVDHTKKHYHVRPWRLSR